MNLKKKMSLVLGTVVVATSLNVIGAFAETSSIDIQDNTRLRVQMLESKYLDNFMYEENKNLNTQQVVERFEKINSSYDVGEPFSEKDAEFVVNYANENNEARQTDTKSFDRTKEKYGVKVRLKGYVKSTVNVLNHKFGGDYSSAVLKGSHTKSLSNQVSNSAYGLVGTSGTYIGLVHKGSVGNSTTSAWKYTQPLYSNKYKEYSAAGVVYTYTNAYVTVKTNAGSAFTLYAFD